MMNLNEYGAACRCLLRLRENQGEPGMTDAAFIARFLPQYPEWRSRPGVADAAAVIEIARNMQLATSGRTVGDYEGVLADYSAGHSVLVHTESVPEQIEVTPQSRSYTTLLVDMTPDHFTLWCPYPSGQSDTLAPAPRVWWELWRASGIVLYQVPAPAADTPA